MNAEVHRASLIILAVGMASFAQNEHNSRAPESCAAKVVFTEYPHLAALARIAGTVYASYAVDADGRVHKVKLEGHPILAKSVDERVRQAKYPESCRSRSVDFVFRFEFDDNIEASEKPATTVKFNPPMEYLITIGPQLIICAYEAKTEPARLALILLIACTW